MKILHHLLLVAGLVSSDAPAQDVRAEMERAEKFGRETHTLVQRNEVRPFWAADVPVLIYQVNTGKDTRQFMRVDLSTGNKVVAFDHEALAKSLGKATGTEIPPAKLPLENLVPTVDPGTLRFRAHGKGWRYQDADHSLTPDEVPPQAANLLAPEELWRGRERHNSGPTEITVENATTGEIELFWVDRPDHRVSYGKVAPGKTAAQPTHGGHAWLVADADGKPLAGLIAKETPVVARITGKVTPPPKAQPQPRGDLSPSEKWHAFIRDYNVMIEPAQGGKALALTNDGSADNEYTGPLQWSPNSRRLIAWRAKRIDVRQIHIVQSSPPDQLQPKLLTFDYPKPGDPLHQPKPCLIDVEQQRVLPVDDALFNNPWEITAAEWAADSSEFSFVYNQRGHQVMRIVAIRGDSGSTRTIFEDISKTFVDYSQKFYFRRLPNSLGWLWASERDGYNHIYLLDPAAGRVKQQITSGQWNVREVVDVNVEKQQLLLKVMGLPGQSPYHHHFARINFDGTGWTRLTTSDGHHRIEFSPDHRWLLDTWSRVDQPPVVEVRRADDGQLIAELERADDTMLRQTGWSRPERFVAKGRDGTTDIYGIIIRPSHFDPAKKYPVLEDIYAGPHDHFVPQNFFAWSNKNAMAELGFVVVSIDGMGTNWRGKAFHDVCWKNLMDAGFPDRITWIKAAAASRPWMDVNRMGIYGGSAGGQSTLAGLLHHGDFYKAGVADCGCHDNRMDKTWWNEAWMGWPVDDSYAKNSNVTHAAKLTGKLLLVVGELDHNVDPASTAQVVAALEKAGKDFEFLPMMNSDHGAAESPYGKYRRAEFFIRHLRN